MRGRGLVGRGRGLVSRGRGLVRVGGLGGRDGSENCVAPQLVEAEV
jgi:hypothetical protein